MSKELRLRPKPIPVLLRGISAERLLRSAWRDEIRPEALTEAKNGLCTRCGSADAVDVHEEWEYDEAGSVATVVGLAPICKDCHAVIHINQPWPIEYRNRLVQHAADVNGMTLDETQALFDSAIGAWERGPVWKPWEVVVSPEVVARYPSMALFPERARAKFPLSEEWRERLPRGSGRTGRAAPNRARPSAPRVARTRKTPPRARDRSIARRRIVR